MKKEQKTMVDTSELIDIEKVVIRDDLPVAQRVADYIKQIKTRIVTAVMVWS